MKRLVLLAVLAVAGCASVDPATPNPCVDQQYVQLKAEPVDSLTQREYERLRDLDRSCREYRTVRELDRTNKMGGPGRAFFMVMGTLVALTGLLIVAAP